MFLKEKHSRNLKQIQTVQNWKRAFMLHFCQWNENNNVRSPLSASQMQCECKGDGNVKMFFRASGCRLWVWIETAEGTNDNCLRKEFMCNVSPNSKLSQPLRLPLYMYAKPEPEPRDQNQIQILQARRTKYLRPFLSSDDLWCTRTTWDLEIYASINSIARARCKNWIGDLG